MKVEIVSTQSKPFDVAMEITDQADADHWFAEYIETNLPRYSGRTREEVERIVRSDLGYYAGYYSDETRERVERLFNCAHPFFGKFVENGRPTFEQALRMGIAVGKASIGETEGES